MTYDKAMIHARNGQWMTRQAWIDDDLCKQVTMGRDSRMFTEYYDIGERASYVPTPHDISATDWRYSPS